MPHLSHLLEVLLLAVLVFYIILATITTYLSK